MDSSESSTPVRLSVVIPCYNECNTLERCVQRVLGIQDGRIDLEIIIVDDGSQDGSLAVAQSLAAQHSEILVLRHAVNQGKGRALRTAFARVTGDFVAVQDADLEYDPHELKRLLIPLVNDDADVVLGSRFLTGGAHRVLYFWHYLGNSVLTFLSNMFSDLNLTDMETCYKVFRKDALQGMEIEEKGFGVEPELVAKIARMRLRVYEMGISYYGRTYEEGKKIRLKDGLRALYCIFHYNAPTAPLPVQFIIYLFIGGFSALFNILAFIILFRLFSSLNTAVPTAFLLAATANYFLCITLLFRHKARWRSATEILIYILLVCLAGIVDFCSTRILVSVGIVPWASKTIACILGLALNFPGRRYLVFPESPAGPWRPQLKSVSGDQARNSP